MKFQLNAIPGNSFYTDLKIQDANNTTVHQERMGNDELKDITTELLTYLKSSLDTSEYQNFINYIKIVH